MKRINLVIISVLVVLILGINSVFAVNSTAVSNSTLTNELTEEQVKEEKSNKNLQSLNIEGYSLNPYFNKNTLNYKVIIPKDITSLEIEAEPEVEGAIVKISGNKSITKSDSNVTIRVTAIDGTSKVYTITVLKMPEVELKLESLKIDEINLEPSFDSDTFYYTSSLIDTELTKVNVNAVANDENANIEIIGADNLIDGENLINIIVSNDDETTIYQIELDVDMLGEKEKEKSDLITRVRQIINYSILGFAGFILFIVFILIIVLIKKIVNNKKHKKYRDDFDD